MAFPCSSLETVPRCLRIPRVADTQVYSFRAVQCSGRKFVWLLREVKMQKFALLQTLVLIPIQMKRMSKCRGNLQKSAQDTSEYIKVFFGEFL